MQTNHVAPQSTSTRTQRFSRPVPGPYGGNFLLTPSLQDYLVPDLTLPEQYAERHRVDDGMGPEKALMYAVLKDGIRCFYKNVGATRRRYVKMFTEAEEWLQEDTYEDPFSFRSICDTLGIDADCLRQRLLDWRDQELRRRELTGDTSSVQLGRSPFPAMIDLDRLERGNDDEGDDWSEDDMSLDDLTFDEQLVRAA
jgi:hypothetical protein